MKIRAKIYQLRFWGIEDLWSSFFFSLVFNESSQWKGDHAHIRQRNPRSTALSLSNAILFTISMLQVKVVEKVCQDLTPWPVQKKGIQMYYSWKDAMKPQWGQIFWEWFIIIIYKRNRYMYMYRPVYIMQKNIASSSELY